MVQGTTLIFWADYLQGHCSKTNFTNFAIYLANIKSSYNGMFKFEQKFMKQIINSQIKSEP